RVSSRESSGGSSTVTSSAWLPWLLWIVIANIVSTSPSRLGEVDTMFAMTIHKSQGSQADEVTVLLPPEDSRLLTR
ncbi:hypothetical protein C6A85_05705, partial [Mycobacterium sp. ITM-2017-0098]